MKKLINLILIFCAINLISCASNQVQNSEEDYSEEYDYSKAAYKITPRNIYWVIRFFNTIMKWFYDDEYSDLFLENEDGKLIFNADYKNLSASTKQSEYDTQILKAIPSMVSKFAGRRRPSVVRTTRRKCL